MILTNKPVGKTPLEIITQLKSSNNDLAEKKMAYAGRLDPMAEGLLLILEGDECLERKKYERLNKVYEFEAVFGLSSDTYDLMGLIDISNLDKKTPTNDQIKLYLKSIPKVLEQPYPPYSSIRVSGKPLFYWARQNLIDKIVVPKKKVEVEDLKLISHAEVSFNDFISASVKKIETVNGDFRQREIINGWENIRTKKSSVEYLKIFKFQVSCSSGFYVRSFVNEMGIFFNCGAVTASIKRTMIGSYSLSSTGKVSGHDKPRQIFP